MTDTTADILQRLRWYESIVHAAPVWCTVYDGPNDRFLWANPAMLQDVGNVVGRPFSDFVISRDIDSTRDVVDDQKKGATLAGFVNTYRLRDGSTVDIEWFAREPLDLGLICAMGVPRG